ncbi:MAG: DNA starvation/stationary phase protection protein [Bryobacterales bacterium]|nr:DNA starvation/stationary phase protection protein [Bryobacterales bacterium]
MSNKRNSKTASEHDQASPVLAISDHPLQAFRSVTRMPIGLDEDVCSRSIEVLNQILADTIALRDLYKKHHWQVAGPTFLPLHELFDKHAAEQNEIVDMLAERVQLLGGVSVAAAADVVELTQVPRPPKEREEVPTQISRLVEAHEIILREARRGARQASEAGDEGTNDLLVSDVVRTNELEVWFISQHLVNVPLSEEQPNH